MQEFKDKIVIMKKLRDFLQKYNDLNIIIN
jgi:hypothetical protein